MASVEQREAVKKVRDWYRANEDRFRLKRGSTRNFSFVRLRREEALRRPVVRLDSSDSLTDEVDSYQITLPNLRPFIKRLQHFFQEDAAIF